MSTQTANLKLVKPLENEFYDINIMNENMDKIDDAVKRIETPYVATTNVGNVYTAIFNPAITELVDGQEICVKVNANSTGAVSLKPNTLAAIPVKKSNGLAVTNWKAEGIYNLRYNATTENFILQGEGGEYGTAGASQVLAGYSIGTESGIVNGVMLDRTSGSFLADNVAISGNSLYLSIPDPGYYGELAEVYATDPDFIAANIKTGIDIFGKVGTFTADANAAAAHILNGRTAYVNGAKVTGNVPVRTNTDTSGSYPVALQDSIYSGIAHLLPPPGYYDGSVWVKCALPGIAPANILNGINIGTGAGGVVTGTAPRISSASPNPTGGYDGDYYIQI